MKADNLKLEWEPIFPSIKKGLLKQWIYIDRPTYLIMHEYVTKIDQSVKPINDVLEDFSYNDMTIVYLITTIDWIIEGSQQIASSIRPEILKGFNFPEENEYIKACTYFKNLRPFFISHSINKNEYKKGTLEGEYVFMGIADELSKNVYIKLKDHDCCRFINYDGIFEGASDESDIYLRCFSRTHENGRYGFGVGVNLKNIIDAARIALKKVHALDDYASNLKRADFAR